MMTFKDRYLAGEVEFEAIDDYVEEWNGSDDRSGGLSVWKYGYKNRKVM